MVSRAWMTWRQTWRENSGPRPPKQRRKRRPRLHWRENQQRRGEGLHQSLSKAAQKFVSPNCMSIGRAPKRAARPSQALDKFVGFCSQHWQNDTSLKFHSIDNIIPLTQTLSQPWVLTDPTKCRLQLLKERPRAWPQCSVEVNHITIGSSWIGRNAKLRSRRGQQILWKTSWHKGDKGITAEWGPTHWSKHGDQKMVVGNGDQPANRVYIPMK